MLEGNSWSPEINLGVEIQGLGESLAHEGDLTHIHIFLTSCLALVSAAGHPVSVKGLSPATHPQVTDSI